MLNYLIENKEWLFSGGGIVIASYVYSSIFKNKKVVIDSNPVKNENISNQEFSSKSKKDKVSTEVSRLSLRFNTTLELMNQGSREANYSIAKLAQILDLCKISELENIFTGKVEPSFEFIERYTKTFGINKHWLIEGTGTPYSNFDTSRHYPMDYLSLITELKPEGIYFVREDSDSAPAFIMLKLTEWRYLVLSKTWHISDNVGHGGKMQLLSLYKLIKELRDERNLYSHCWGLTLNKEDFSSLFNGEVFPGIFVEYGFSEDPWWDDLTDINNKYPLSKNYPKMHGKSFVRAQEIIKCELKKKSELN